MSKLAKWAYSNSYILVFGILAILPLFLSSYGTNVLTEILIYGIFAMSLNLLLGYTGLPSFGHAAFFGVGTYMVGFLTTKVLPCSGIGSFLLVISLSVLASFLVGTVFGVLVVRSSGATFLMLTLALAQVLWGIAFSWRSVTGGDDGIAGIPRIDFGLASAVPDTVTFYYLAFLFFVLSSAVLHRIVRSPFGHALLGIRENELRMQAIGFNTWSYKYIAYITAGIFGALGGVLHAYFYRHVSPHDLSIDLSGTAMFIAIIGGRTVFFGPLVGSAIVFLLKYLVGSLTEYWQFFLGLTFVLSVMFARKGLSFYFIEYVMECKVLKWKP